MNWLYENKEWLFSGIGVAVVGFVFTKLFSKHSPSNLVQSPSIDSNNNSIEITIGTPSKDAEDMLPSVEKPKKTLEDYKNETRILFVDDDARFKVAKILAKSGWVHTKLIKDCETLDDQDVKDAQILFIDVQGVGVAMSFSDEGLGLALAIKQKYPKKTVVIYSAETNGDRFHKALREADSFLPKNADPYEFQKIVEEFTVGAMH